jgi:hypothetical protein
MRYFCKNCQKIIDGNPLRSQLSSNLTEEMRPAANGFVPRIEGLQEAPLSKRRSPSAETCDSQSK